MRMDLVTYLKSHMYNLRHPHISSRGAFKSPQTFTQTGPRGLSQAKDHQQIKTCKVQSGTFSVVRLPCDLHAKWKLFSVTGK